MNPVHYVYISILLLSSLLSGGCTTLNKDECLNANWRVIGFEDSSRGHKSDRIGEHRSACAKYAVAPDLASYQTGYKEGLEVFCKPQSGYHYGLNGQSYQGICPSHLEQDFLPAYNYGKEIYNTGSKLNTVKSQYQDTVNKRHSIDKTIKDKERVLVASANTPAQRQSLLDEIKNLTAQRDSLEIQAADLDSKLSDLTRQLAQLKNRSPYR